MKKETRIVDPLIFEAANGLRSLGVAQFEGDRCLTRCSIFDDIASMWETAGSPDMPTLNDCLSFISAVVSFLETNGFVEEVDGELHLTAAGAAAFLMVRTSRDDVGTEPSDFEESVQLSFVGRAKRYASARVERAPH